MEHNFNPPSHCTHNRRKTLLLADPRLQKTVVKITAQVMQMTTSGNVILYDMGPLIPSNESCEGGATKMHISGSGPWTKMSFGS